MNSGSKEVLIVFLVPATSESQALARSKVALSQVLRSVERPAESFTEIRIFEQGATDQTEGWDELPTAASLETDIGTTLLDEAISMTEKAFRKNLQQLRESLDRYTEDEFLRNEDMVRNLFLSLGAFVGPSVQVYTSGGRPLRCRSDLCDYKADHDSLWVVPAKATYHVT